MALAGQTITIVNNSGKIVKSTKHLVNIFNEAKAAYNEKKAEIKAQRDTEWNRKNKEHHINKHLEALHIEDDGAARSTTSARRHSEDGKSTRRKPVPNHSNLRPQLERGVSDSFYVNDLHDQGQQSRHDHHHHHHHQHPSPPQNQSHRSSPLRHEASQSVVDDEEPRIKELTRRHTEGLELAPSRRSKAIRRASTDGIDMDLAYGEIPPPLPTRKYDEEIELRSKMSGLQKLLDEFNCVQHTATATIDKLQKNPEALAAVALTLGEISNLAMKMAPGALTAMKSSFPAIIALLASPQFAIAAGVGVGVTIIAFGGYKIIKKIQARNEEARLLEMGRPVKQIAEEPADGMEELREINHIERWRRGIAEAEADSLGTSVDGEFITPQATRTLVQEGKLTEADLKPPASVASKSHRSKRRTKSTVSSASKTKSRSGVRVKTSKEPSGLKMLFMGRSA